MNDELKQLIEDAAKLLGLSGSGIEYAGGVCLGFRKQDRTFFAPLDPERGDLMKVAEAAELIVDFTESIAIREVQSGLGKAEHFTKGDYQSLALAILRAASDVLHSRNANNWR